MRRNRVGEAYVKGHHYRRQAIPPSLAKNREGTAKGEKTRIASPPTLGNLELRWKKGVITHSVQVPGGGATLITRISEKGENRVVMPLGSGLDVGGFNQSVGDEDGNSTRSKGSPANQFLTCRIQGTSVSITLNSCQGRKVVLTPPKKKEKGGRPKLNSSYGCAAARELPERKEKNSLPNDSLLDTGRDKGQIRRLITVRPIRRAASREEDGVGTRMPGRKSLGKTWIRLYESIKNESLSAISRAKRKRGVSLA